MNADADDYSGDEASRRYERSMADAEMDRIEWKSRADVLGWSEGENPWEDQMAAVQRALK